MFHPNKGIILPDCFQIQKRITDEIIFDKDNIGKFSFFPKRLVTLQVFNILRTFKNRSLLYGAPGISKTTSIIFYSYLNYLISSYEF